MNPSEIRRNVGGGRPTFYCRSISAHRKTILFWLLVLLHSSWGLAQSAETFEIVPGSAYSVKDFAGYLSYLEDPDHLLSIDDWQSPSFAEWRPLGRSSIDFGFSSAKFWLHLPVKNSSDVAGTWLLNLNSRFMTGLDVYLVTKSGNKKIIHDTELKHFSEREIPYRHLVSKFELKPNEQGSLVIGYWSRGATVLPITIETENSFYQGWIKENVIIVAFYSAMAFMMLFAVAQLLILKRPVQLSYALYVASGCLYVFHMDGLSFKFFWPDSPIWNADASLLLGLNIGVFSIIFARTFLHASVVMPKIDKALLTVLIFILVLMVASVFVDMRHLKQHAFLVTTTAVLFCLISGVVAYLRGQKDARFYVMGWIGLFLSTAFASVSHVVERVLPIPLTFDFAKVGIFVDSIMFAMAMADQANEVRKQRDESQQRERAFLEQDLEAQRQINLLENQYQSAMSLAQKQTYTLASAGHDLRQPIVALKAAMNQVTQRDDVNVSTVNQFRQGFEYIEKLIKEYLDLPQEVMNSHPDQTLDDQHQGHGKPKSGEELFPANVILKNVCTMFRDDAAAKGVEFRCCESSAMVKANPVGLMRLLTNLVQNAIKYTPEGKILIGCRRRPQLIEFQVWDTGPGLSDAQQKNIFDVYQRETDSETEGHGLGLAIVRKLVDENNYTLVLDSRLGEGSVFKVGVLRANSIT